MTEGCDFLNGLRCTKFIEPRANTCGSFAVLHVIQGFVAFRDVLWPVFTFQPIPCCYVLFGDDAPLFRCLLDSRSFPLLSLQLMCLVYLPIRTAAVYYLPIPPGFRPVPVPAAFLSSCTPTIPTLATCPNLPSRVHVSPPSIPFRCCVPTQSLEALSMKSPAVAPSIVSNRSVMRALTTPFGK